MKQIFCSIACTMVLMNGASAQSIRYPKTDKVAQTDNYFGKQIADPYRWLGDDTATKTAA
jgi:prolyl oligopeptidase